MHAASQHRSSDTGDALAWAGYALALGLTLAFLYLVPARVLGFWEPWETSLATLGRSLSESPSGSVFAALRGDELIGRPWLQTVLLRMGFELGGGSEFGFRLPFALLGVTGALGVFGGLARAFGPLRAALVGLLFGMAPAALLSSISLAGDAVSIVPMTLAILAFGGVLAERGAHAAWRLPFGALMLGLSYWGAGLFGFALPVGVVAVLALSLHDPERDNRLPLLFAGLVLLAGAAICRSALSELGWEDAKDLVGVVALLFGPVAVLAASFGSARSRVLLHPIGTPLALVVLLAVAYAPTRALVAEVNEVRAAAFLLYPEWLTSRVLPDHVTFDVLIRLAGAAAYPLTLFAPLGFAYLARTLREEVPSDDRTEESRVWKQLFLIWMAIGFVLSGLMVSLGGDYFAPFVLPIAAAVGLALSDESHANGLIKNRIAFHTAGLASLMLLLVTSKDMRGTFDEEGGRPGPHFFFEMLLLDGAVEFPEDYALNYMSVFVGLWALLILAYFAAPSRTVREFGHTLLELSDGPAGQATGLRRALQKAQRPARTLAARLGQLSVRAGDTLGRLVAPLTGPTTGIRLLAGAFLFSVLAWNVTLVVRCIPEVTNHFSQKGIIDTYEELAGDDATLYTAGIRANDNSYYMSGQLTEPLERIEDIRGLFCGAEERLFVIVPFERLAEAHYHVRHAEGGRRGEVEPREDCAEGGELFVIDGRSSRYVLLSNRLLAGEEDQSAVGANVFAPDALPEHVQEPAEAVTVDDRLRLVAVDLSPRELDSGDLVVAAYWEVLDRPTSNFEVFIHGDFGGNRLNGDHDPVNGLFPMRWWVPGEVVRDEFVIDVSSADKAGEYTMWYGFFRGDDRLEVSPARGDNRINLGTVVVR